MNRELQRVLEDAAWDGDALTVAGLINHPDVEPAADRSTALLHAAHRGHWRCVEILLPVSNPLARSSEALWRAARYGHPRCVRLLAPVSDTAAWSVDLWNQLPPRMRAALSAPMTEPRHAIKANGLAADNLSTNLRAQEGTISVVKNSDTTDYVELMRYALDHRTGCSEDGPEGLIVCDVHGSIVFANATAKDIVGLVRIGALPDDYSCMHGIFSEEGRPFPSSDVPLARAVMQGESARDVRLVVRRGDGEAHLLSVDAYPLHDASGAVIGAATTFRVFKGKQ